MHHLASLVTAALLLGAVNSTLVHGQASESIDATYLPERAFFVFVIRPAAVIELLGEENESARAVSENYLRRTGLELANVDSFVLAAILPEGRSELAYESCMILRFVEPIEPEQVMQTWFGRPLQPTVVAGRDCFSVQDTPVVVCYPDRTTMILGAREVLQAALDELTGSEAADLVSPLTIDAQLAASFRAPENGQDRGRLLLRTFDGLGLNLSELVWPGGAGEFPVIDEVTEAALALRVTEDRVAQLDVKLRDAAAAEDFADRVSTVIRQGREGMPAAERELEEFPAHRLRGMKSVLSATRLGLEHMRLESRENSVRISIERTDGMLEILSAIADRLAAVT